MMTTLRNLSIRRKLTFVILATNLAVLLIACVALFAYELVTFRRVMLEDMTVFADVIGRNSTAALSFQDEGAAQETLSALAAEPHVMGAVLYGMDDKPLAQYVRPNTASVMPPEAPPTQALFTSGTLVVSRPVQLKEKTVGTIYIQSDLGRMDDRLRSYLVIVVTVVLVALVVVYLISSALQQVISRPILALAETARTVSEKKDYSVRASKQGEDEIGLLVDAVNQMLTEIETGQQAVREVNRSLEARTAQLEQANRSLEAQAAH